MGTSDRKDVARRQGRTAVVFGTAPEDTSLASAGYTRGVDARRLGALAMLLGACTSAPPGDRDASPLRLVCETPLSTALVPSTYPSNRGVPMAGIAWTGDHCALEVDEMHPDLVLLVADFTGSIFGDAPVATRIGDWRIVSSSHGAAGASYIAPVPRDADVEVTLERSGVRVTIAFRLEASVLVLTSMRLS
jgi:hypothetical protein